jgi:Domain of unknown function (DUF5601)
VTLFGTSPTAERHRDRDAHRDRGNHNGKQNTRSANTKKQDKGKIHDEEEEEEDEESGALFPEHTLTFQGMVNYGQEDEHEVVPKDFFISRVNRPNAAPLSALIKRFVHKFKQHPPPLASQPTVVRKFLTTMEHTILQHPIWKGGWLFGVSVQ